MIRIKNHINNLVILMSLIKISFIYFLKVVAKKIINGYVGFVFSKVLIFWGFADFIPNGIFKNITDAITILCIACGIAFLPYFIYFICYIKSKFKLLKGKRKLPIT